MGAITPITVKENWFFPRTIPQLTKVQFGLNDSVVVERAEILDGALNEFEAEIKNTGVVIPVARYPFREPHVDGFFNTDIRTFKDQGYLYRSIGIRNPNTNQDNPIPTIAFEVLLPDGVINKTPSSRIVCSFGTVNNPGLDSRAYKPDLRAGGIVIKKPRYSTVGELRTDFKRFVGEILPAAMGWDYELAFNEFNHANVDSNFMPSWLKVRLLGNAGDANNHFLPVEGKQMRAASIIGAFKRAEIEVRKTSASEFGISWVQGPRRRELDDGTTEIIE